MHGQIGIFTAQKKKKEPISGATSRADSPWLKQAAVDIGQLGIMGEKKLVLLQI